MSRCRCCGAKLFEYEIIESNDGLCNRCIFESKREYSYVYEHEYEHGHINDGMTPPKKSEY